MTGTGTGVTPAGASVEDAAAACALFAFFGCEVGGEDLGLPPLVFGGMGTADDRLKKKADDLISGFLKRSESYHSEYGGKTYQEIKDLAGQGDQRARQMKKLIEQGPRIRNK